MGTVMRAAKPLPSSTPAQRLKRFLLYPWLVILTAIGIAKGSWTGFRSFLIHRDAKQYVRDLRLVADQSAFIEGPVLSLIGGVVAIVFAVVGLIMVASLLPSYVNAGANASKAITAADFGNAQTNQLRAPFQLLLGVLILIGAVMIVLGFIFIRK